MRSMTKIREFKSPDAKVHAILYAFDTPQLISARWGTDPKPAETRYFWVSASTKYTPEGEVYVFPADAEGEWLSSCETESSRNGTTCLETGARLLFADTGRNADGDRISG